jgi:hypothetical protein
MHEAETELQFPEGLGLTKPSLPFPTYTEYHLNASPVAGRDRYRETLGPYQGCPVREAGCYTGSCRGQFDRALTFLTTKRFRMT